MIHGATEQVFSWTLSLKTVRKYGRVERTHNSTWPLNLSNPRPGRRRKASKEEMIRLKQKAPNPSGIYEPLQTRQERMSRGRIPNCLSVGVEPRLSHLLLDQEHPGFPVGFAMPETQPLSLGDLLGMARENI